MQLSIIIVNYNVKYFLEQCLHSVVKAAKNLDAEIFVVDNNSSDGSMEFFKQKFANVKFIWNAKNVGFAKANNKALWLAEGKYVLFLNPDTIVPEDCFIKCMSFFESQPDAGALGIHMIDGSGKFLKESKRAFPSPLTSLYKLSGLAKLFPRSKRFARYHLGYLDENKNSEVDVLAAAFVMVPKKITDIVGGFDEEFFMYGEDVDLSYRVQRAGYKNFYFAESTIIHFKGESTKKGSVNYVKMFYKAMSIFVKKHHQGNVGIFNFLVQCAILLRGVISAAGRLIRWIGMPVIDALIILFSFWLTKILWNNYIKQEVRYSENLLMTAFSVFTLIFLLASYFSGLYDSAYKQSKLNRSAIVAIAVLLAGYSLLPETLRFSRGILVFGSLMAYLFISLVRRLLVNFKLLENYGGDEDNQTIIAGTPDECSAVMALLKSASTGERILGRVTIVEESGAGALANITDLANLLKMFPIKEVILCEGKATFKEIIEVVKTIPRGVKLKFFASTSESIIGSDNKNVSGNYVTGRSKFKVESEVGKRNKRLADLIICAILLVSCPLHLLFQKNSGNFFKNVSDVLVRKKTWVGYASSLMDLPVLKPGILSVTGVPNFMNTMPEDSLELADKWYAKQYTIWHDIQLVFRNYNLLNL